MGRAKRMDANHPDLRNLARAMGVSWADTHMVGNGFADAVLGFSRRNYLLELKDGSKPPSRRILTPDEKEFFIHWQGQIEVIESEEQLVDFINRKRGGDE